MRAESKKAVELAKAGTAPRDIAHQLGMDQTAVYSTLKYARLKGEDVPFFSTKPVAVPSLVASKNLPQIVIPNRLYALLAREAERRGKTAAETAQHLLEDALLRRVRP